ALQAFAGQVGAVLQRLELQAASDDAAATQRLLAASDHLLLGAADVPVAMPTLARQVFDAGLLPLRALVLLRAGEGGVRALAFRAEGRDADLEAALASDAARPAALAGLEARVFRGSLTG